MAAALMGLVSGRRAAHRLCVLSGAGLIFVKLAQGHPFEKAVRGRFFKNGWRQGP